MVEARNGSELAEGGTRQEADPINWKAFLTSSTRAGSTAHTGAYTGLTARMAGFAELGLSSWLVEQCRQLGLKQPTPVQLGCIPAILEGECG